MVNDSDRLDAVYAALSDPTRRRMVESLATGPLSVSALAAPFTMTLAAVGKHISVLETAGIVRTHKSGRVRSCSVVPHALAEANAWLAAQEAFWNSRLDSLTTYLEENP
jgi:DNA-binding transcriptional ArsR family regulator